MISLSTKFYIRTSMDVDLNPFFPVGPFSLPGIPENTDFFRPLRGFCGRKPRFFPTFFTMSDLCYFEKKCTGITETYSYS